MKKASDRKRGGLPPWMAGLWLSCLLIPLAVAFWTPIRQRFWPVKPTVDALEAAAKGGGGADYIEAYRESFPDEYRRVLHGAMDVVDKGGGTDAAVAVLKDREAQVLARHGVEILRAPDQELAFVIRDEGLMLDQLDTPTCARFATTGRVSWSAIPPSWGQATIVYFTASMLKAARAGIDHPTDRPAQPTPGDRAALLRAAAGHGVTPTQIDAVRNGTLQTLDPRDQCIAMRGTIKAMSSLEWAQSSRLWPHFLPPAMRPAAR